MAVNIESVGADELLSLARVRGEAAPHKRNKVFCCECGHEAHRLSNHITEAHDGLTLAEYQAKWPGAPIRSAFAAQESGGSQAQPTRQAAPPGPGPVVKCVMDFQIGTGKASVPQWDGWDDEDAAAIPPWDEDFEINGMVEEQLGQLALGLELAENTMIIGPTGAGKTSLVDVIAALTNQPVTRINFHGEMRPSDLVGDIELIETEGGNAITRWADGPLTRGLRRGHIILIDEIDAAPPQLHTLLQRLCERHPNPLKAIEEGQPHIKLLLSSGEVVGANHRTRLIATANTAGTGDMTGDYAGTFVLNAAFLDRWSIKIKYGYPEKPVWRAILMKKTSVDAKTADMIVDVAGKINEAKAKGSCRVSLSPRKSLAWARIAKRVGKLRLAADLTIINGIDAADPDYKFIIDIITQVAGR